MRVPIGILLMMTLLVACNGTEDVTTGGEEPPTSEEEFSEAELAFPLHFRAGGPEGEYRLSLQPDGEAEGQLGVADPFSFTMGDPELTEIAELVLAADLENQPAHLEGEDVEDGYRTILEYGNAEVLVTGNVLDAPAVTDLTNRLIDLLEDRYPGE